MPPISFTGFCELSAGRLIEVLERLQAGITLNKQKCQETVKFLGHVISKLGIQSDPDKIKAILDMQRITVMSKRFVE